MTNKNWKTKTLLIGALIGMITGLGIAWLQVREAETQNRELHYDARDTARVGAIILDAIKRIV